MRLPPHFQLAKILHRLLGPSTAARSEQVAFPFLYARVVEIPNHRHKENAIQQFIEKYQSQIQGTLSGFDRLVFRGSLRRLNIGWWDKNQDVFIARGMEEYLWQREILFKNFSEHVKQVSSREGRCGRSSNAGRSRYACDPRRRIKT